LEIARRRTKVTLSKLSGTLRARVQSQVVLGRYIRGGFGKKEWLGKLLKPYMQGDNVDSREVPLPLTRGEISGSWSHITGG